MSLMTASYTIGEGSPISLGDYVEMYDSGNAMPSKSTTVVAKVAMFLQTQVARRPMGARDRQIIIKISKDTRITSSLETTIDFLKWYYDLEDSLAGIELGSSEGGILKLNDGIDILSLSEALYEDSELIRNANGRAVALVRFSFSDVSVADA